MAGDPSGDQVDEARLVTGLLGLYWGPRQAPFDDCARKVYELLIALKEHGYDRFFKLGRSRRNALKREFDVTDESARKLLARGVNRADVGRKVSPDLGWKLSLWSGGPNDKCYSISFTVGAYSKWVGNAVVPPALGRYSLAENSAAALGIYNALLGIWSPEQAVVCKGGIVRSAQPRQPRQVDDVKPGQEASVGRGAWAIPVPPQRSDSQCECYINQARLELCD